jgi:hypothetical protein
VATPLGARVFVAAAITAVGAFVFYAASERPAAHVAVVPPSPRRWAIGLLRDLADHPLEGWRIEGYVADAAGCDPTLVGESITDAAGRFRLRPFGAHELRVRAFPPRGGPRRIDPDVIRCDVPDVVVVAAPEFEPEASIEGRLIDEGGRPAVWRWLRFAPADGLPAVEALTDMDGRFHTWEAHDVAFDVFLLVTREDGMLVLGPKLGRVHGGAKGVQLRASR